VQGLCRFGDVTGGSGSLVFRAAFRWATNLAYIGALLELLRLSAVVIPSVRSLIRLVRRQGRPHRALTEVVVQHVGLDLASICNLVAAY
jgi:hypothetical protein